MAEVMVCGECGKVLSYDERKLAGKELTSDEEIPCPYGAHAAGVRASQGWWESLPMSPAEQDAWRDANPLAPAQP